MKAIWLGGFFLPLTLLAQIKSARTDHFGTSARSGEVLRAIPVQSRYFFIKKPYWDEEDEREFSRFVAALAKSKCNNIKSCLNSEANPYRDTDPADLVAHTDCADFPYMLRAYFAWKKGLPFSIPVAVSTKDSPRADGKRLDYRYTELGNSIASRMEFTGEPVIGVDGRVQADRGNHYTIDQVWNQIANRLSSAVYRTDPRVENPDKFTDFYPIKLEQGVLRPGSIVYKTSGHVALVGEVKPNGDVILLQAGVDGDISRLPFDGNDYRQSRTEHSAGFRNWRPLHLEGSQANSYGIHVGGRVRAKTNADLEATYSLEQYRSENGHYNLNGQKLRWPQYVQARLSGEKWRRDPLREIDTQLATLCRMIQIRAGSVKKAVDQGLPTQPHPQRLPSNIYGAEDAQWELFSTPGRDADIRGLASNLVANVKELLALKNAELDKTVYRGSDLKNDLAQILRQQDSSCEISYLNSRQRPVNLSLTTVLTRLDRISFDPYHCPELRWGASGAELGSCVQDPSSQAWYEVEAPLRTHRSRGLNAEYGYSLEEARVNFRSQREPSVNVDLKALLY